MLSETPRVHPQVQDPGCADIAQQRRCVQLCPRIYSKRHFSRVAFKIATPCGKVGRMPGRFRRRAPAANAALGGSGCGRHVLLGSVPRGLDDDQDQVSWSALQHSGALRS